MQENKSSSNVLESGEAKRNEKDEGRREKENK